MIANEMFRIANEYNKDIVEVHKVFYQVNCRKDKLEQALDGKYKAWTKLEDLALRNGK